MSPESFGFTVGEVTEVDRAGWYVSLPHQCSSWDIAGEDSYHGVTHEHAVAELERFIAEAQTALAALRYFEYHGDWEQYWQDWT